MGALMHEEKAYKRIVSGTRAYFKKAGFPMAVFGLSGGLDSSVTAFILADALGPGNVTAIHMPLATGASVADLRDAVDISKITGINFLVFPVGRACEFFSSAPWRQNRLSKANIQARSRMVALYSFANSRNALVAGTSNRTELLLGYFTKHGDGACDLLPLGSLYKTEVKALAEWLKVPKKILKKKPTAGLWRGQTDEKEIGLSYKKIDGILKAKFGGKKSEKKLFEEFGRKNVKKVLGLSEKNAHKGKTLFVVKA